MLLVPLCENYSIQKYHAISTWAQRKKWMPRKQGTPIDACPDVHKVNGQQYPTYEDAHLALGLLEDDNQWDCMLIEAALNCAAIQIRLLYAIELTDCMFPSPSRDVVGKSQRFN
ncbi:ATP-dependent DNA helicase [Trichonephila clavata]|uniref:ATP-dependent DNA helicase n=1 Tax=Trichonephila clavata TaxID=2740835 RepID=A0A8X6FR53_TRICU|nr:ATP-dependent DNA helicase [Trichonephila clavata]